MTTEAQARYLLTVLKEPPNQVAYFRKLAGTHGPSVLWELLQQANQHAAEQTAAVAHSAAAGRPRTAGGIFIKLAKRR